MYFIYIPVSHFSSGFYHMTFRHLCLRQEVRPQNFSSLCSLVYLSCGYRNHPSHCCARNLHSLLAHCFGLSARFANRPRFDSCCNARRYAAGSVTRALASLEKLSRPLLQVNRIASRFAKLETYLLSSRAVLASQYDVPIPTV